MTNNYLIINNANLSNDLLKSLYNLYLPLIDFKTLDLYLRLVSFTKECLDISNIDICFNINKETFNLCLGKLISFNLIDLYENEDTSVIVINNPLNINNFLNHHLYSRILQQAIGQKSFKELINSEKIINLNKFQNISGKYRKFAIDEWDLKNYAVDLKNQEYQEEYIFDIKHFYNNLSFNLFPNEYRNNHNSKIIACLGDKYAISELEMKSFISIDAPIYDNYELNLGKFETLIIRKLKCHLSSQDKYQSLSKPFLRNLQGFEITGIEINMLKKLQNEYGLNQSVINALLEYSYFNDGKRIEFGLIYTRANNLKINKVVTAKQTFEFLNTKVVYKDKKGLPVEHYTNKDIETLSVEDEKFLKEFFNE